MKLQSHKKMLITENWKLEALTVILTIITTTKHLKSYLETFITEIISQ